MKSLAKNILFALAYYSGLIGPITRAVLRKKSGLPLIILIYHRITEDVNSEINTNLTINHPLRNFVREMRFLKKYFTIVSLDEAAESLKSGKNPDKPTVAITFDDGFEDNYRLAFPVLKELEMPATIFLTAGLIGSERLPWPDEVGRAIWHTKEAKLQLKSCFKNKTFSLRGLKEKRNAHSEITANLKELTYSERLSLTEEIANKLSNRDKFPLPKGERVSPPERHSRAGVRGTRMLTWDEVKEMTRGNISFGAHSMTHPILTKMPNGWAKKEILDSKRTIENRAGLTVRHFAFPNGRPEDFNRDLKTYCEEIGFETVSTAVYGANPCGSDAYGLKRISPGRNIHIFAVDLLRAFLKG